MRGDVTRYFFIFEEFDRVFFYSRNIAHDRLFPKMRRDFLRGGSGVGGGKVGAECIADSRMETANTVKMRGGFW